MDGRVNHWTMVERLAAELIGGVERETEIEGKMDEDKVEEMVIEEETDIEEKR